MTIKLLELRDANTFIPIFAFDISKDDGYLAVRAGYMDRCIVIGKLNGSRCEYDPYNWNDRTFQVAHDYITKNWDELIDHDIIDVEYILGETAIRKISEAFETY